MGQGGAREGRGGVGNGYVWGGSGNGSMGLGTDSFGPGFGLPVLPGITRNYPE